MNTKRLTSLASGGAAAIAALAATGPALAQTPPTTPGYFFGPHTWMWGGHWFAGPLWLLVIVVLIVVFATAVTRRRDGNRAPAAESRAALDILRERFARGEIDKAEFEDRKRVLGY